ncbi:urease accessory protein UreF [Ilumatobacter coccineus]|jgi:urease accessory protein|uniref:Putative urease accessory protein UreF n=1 Tax=Ilumatobacter coccineus (strain NBRC 103263 / KCTC 29153 / YM16-304) TaxID=1313172 RepID=A0A6C7E2D8_ILUCY|nr:urease accessory UreF family protein [Ilumatobacter coccineus]BAN00981.1 putative urease accessory protein UreF [Ilumatobacter coccineus YM16-304]
MNSALLMLVDGRFPAGGHTNSAGVEAAVRIGDIGDGATLERYLLGRLATTGVVDAAFSAHVAGLVAPSIADLELVDAEYSARVPSPRLREASHKFGRQLLRAGRGIWASPTLDAIDARDRATHQAVVLGALCAAAGASPADAALLAFHHLSAAVTSAAIRLLGLDPMEAAAIQARAGHRADRWAADADQWVRSTPAQLPACGGSLTEILAEDHGRWDARLFVA